jgi:hypothetical protein
VALRERPYFTALNACCATEMASLIGFGHYENKRIIKTLLWLNLLENPETRLLLAINDKRIGGLCPAKT